MCGCSFSASCIHVLVLPIATVSKVAIAALGDEPVACVLIHVPPQTEGPLSFPPTYKFDKGVPVGNVSLILQHCSNFVLEQKRRNQVVTS
jgi:hypothetical protein